MKVLTVDQIKALDAYTIKEAGIPSTDLMERAGTSCFDWIIEHFHTYNQAFVLCGPGNNGGDGLVIARKLSEAGWHVEVVYPGWGSVSEDFQVNLNRLTGLTNIQLHPLSENNDLPNISKQRLIFDALFGSGLTRMLDSSLARWVNSVNKLPNLVIAIDIPSGLFADKPTVGIAIEADFTLSFEVPKRAFLMPENQQFIGEWMVLPIGLDGNYLAEIPSKWYIQGKKEVASLLRTRRKFDHKGTFGHALLITGSFGKAGAAILSSKGAIRAGAGLVTTHVPGRLNAILQTALPEVMVDTDQDQYHFTSLDTDTTYSAIGIGCGLGIHEETVVGLRHVLDEIKIPLVLDADALNIMSLHADMLPSVPKNSILTPHFREFERLFGPSDNHFERLDKLQQAALDLQLNIVLKGAHTAIASADGNLYFNSSGNPGMATAGSGDVLTGIITGLLAQRYSPLEAALIGVYLHGVAGDLAADLEGYDAMIASDIIDHLGKAFQHVREYESYE